MFSTFDPSWILYGVAVLAAVGLIREIMREQRRPSDGDRGPFLLFPPPESPSDAAFRLPPEVLNGDGVDPPPTVHQPRAADRDAGSFHLHASPESPAHPSFRLPPEVTNVDRDPPRPAVQPFRPQIIPIVSREPGGAVAAAALKSPATEVGPDMTVQLLPGRLEIVAGPEAGRSIPFVRMPGRGAPEITIGRAEGQLYSHIQIVDHTVSRMHARLRLEARRWSISNLSGTNPVRVNGQELSFNGDAVLLTNGDRIQLGTVELCFREGAA